MGCDVGKMRHRVTLLEPTEGAATSLQSVGRTTYTAAGTRWAEVTAGPSGGLKASTKTTAVIIEADYTIRMHADGLTKQVTAGWRARWNGRLIQIEQDDPTRHHLGEVELYGNAQEADE